MNNNQSVFTSDSNETQEESIFDQASRHQMTPKEKFLASKKAVYERFGVDDQPQSTLTNAEQVAQDAHLSSLMTFHPDGSVTVKGSILGNDKASKALLKHLRQQVYKKYGIEDHGQ